MLGGALLLKVVPCCAYPAALCRARAPVCLLRWSQPHLPSLLFAAFQQCAKTT